MRMTAEEIVNEIDRILNRNFPGPSREAWPVDKALQLAEKLTPMTAAEREEEGRYVWETVLLTPFSVTERLTTVKVLGLVWALSWGHKAHKVLAQIDYATGRWMLKVYTGIAVTECVQKIVEAGQP